MSITALYIPLKMGNTFFAEHFGGIKMKYDLIEIISIIFDIFNNPVGIAAGIVAIAVGILMCIYRDKKSRIIYICYLAALTALGVFVFVDGNSPDLLALPLFMIPLFAVTLVIFLIYDFAKVLMKNK